MITFPNCKINLGLQILQKRNDGYHDLETVFFPIPLTDALEILPTSTGSLLEHVQLSLTGLQIMGDPESNLCNRAYRLLKKDFPDLPPVKIHLHKIIPTGAGLGGGSSNGAFALQLLNQLFKLQLKEDKLLDYALELGSDCPFFIINKPCYATGRGESLTPIDIDLEGYRLMIVNPGIHIPTAQAFQGWKSPAQRQDIRNLLSGPITEWKGQLHNDFENSIFPAFPEISRIKESLYSMGAHYASMTGTGSTVYGLFPLSVQPEYAFPSHYFVRVMELQKTA